MPLPPPRPSIARPSHQPRLPRLGPRSHSSCETRASPPTTALERRAVLGGVKGVCNMEYLHGLNEAEVRASVLHMLLTPMQLKKLFDWLCVLCRGQRRCRGYNSILHLLSFPPSFSSWLGLVYLSLCTCARAATALCWFAVGAFLLNKKVNKYCHAWGVGQKHARTHTPAVTLAPEPELTHTCCDFYIAQHTNALFFAG